MSQCSREGRASNVRFEWVYPTDLRDPTEYLEGRELGPPATDSGVPLGLLEPVRQTAGHVGVAGIGYGLRKPDATTPSDLVEACDAAGMALLEASHDDTAFVAISELGGHLHADARQQRMVPLASAIRDWSSVAGGGGVDEILGILGR